MTTSPTLPGEITGRASAVSYSARTKIFWVLWILLVLLGSIGVAQRLQYGHMAGSYGSYVPWGLWIGLYFLGVGIAGGSFVIGALAYMLDLPGFRQRAALRTAIVLSVAAIIPAFVSVWLDLGRMDRLYKILISPVFTSMMAFNASMYNIFVIVALLSWLISFKQKSVWLKPLMFLGALLSILFPSQSGVFFEAVATKEYWNSPLLSMLFFASAIAVGAAVLLLVRVLVGPSPAGEVCKDELSEHDSALLGLRAITVMALAVYLVFEFAELSITLWSPGRHSPAVDFLLFGPYWWVFWIVHLLLGVAAALILFAFRSPGAWALGALLVALGFVGSRMGILIPGQVVGQIPGLQEAFQDIRLSYSYHPTLTEYLVGIFLVAVGMAIFFVGRSLTKALAARLEKKA
jgi:molybdopterin-containing oxidoreductase family membrane subunit